jgi:hypothetical protein
MVATFEVELQKVCRAAETPDNSFIPTTSQVIHRSSHRPPCAGGNVIKLAANSVRMMATSDGPLLKTRVCNNASMETSSFSA